MTRAVTLREIGEPPRFEVGEVEDPEPADGEALLELVGAEITPFDVQVATGGFPATHPLQPGGSGVARLEDSFVFVAGGLAGMGNRRPGTFAERFVAPRQVLVPVPDGIDPLIAAGGATGTITARLALIDHAGLTSGETVLVLGATGAVGGAAAQIASALGGRVLAAVRDPASYSGPGTAVSTAKLAAQVSDLTGGKGAEVIIDTLGGPFLDRGVASGAPNCRHVVLGYAAGKQATLTITAMLARQHRLLGFSASRAPRERYLQALGEALDDLASRRVVPELKEPFRLEQVAEAYQAVGSSGRVVLVP